MATIRKFEDIEAWKDSMVLADAMYSASNQGPFAKDFGLRDQMRRAAVSISSNIAEGFERNSKPEFIRFLTIAKGSAGELRSQLYLAHRQGYLTDDSFNALYAQVFDVSRKISRFVEYLRNDTAEPTHS